MDNIKVTFLFFFISLSLLSIYTNMHTNKHALFNKTQLSYLFLFFSHINSIYNNAYECFSFFLLYSKYAYIKKKSA